MNMHRYALASAVLTLFMFAGFPGTSHAAAIQNVDGGGIVYLDYAKGKDEIILVNGFNHDETIQWDMYASANPTEVSGWELERSYLANDFVEKNDDYFYNFIDGRAVRFNGAQYFVVSVQSAGDFFTLPVEYEIWRVTKRGGKPQLVLRVDDPSYYSGHHMPLVVLNNTLAFLSVDGSVFSSTNGTDWSTVGNAHDAVGALYHGDFVSDGTTAWLSVGGQIYSSVDAITWTLVNDVCSSETDSCEVYDLQIRPAGGIFALATISADTGSNYKLWTYNAHAWNNRSSFTHLPRIMQTIGDHTYLFLYKGPYEDKHAIKEVNPNGTLKKVTTTHKGSPMIILADRLAAINLTDAAYLTLIRF